MAQHQPYRRRPRLSSLATRVVQRATAAAAREHAAEHAARIAVQLWNGRYCP